MTVAATASATEAGAALRLAVEVGAPVDTTGVGPRARRALELAHSVGAPAGAALHAAAAADAQARGLVRAIEIATAQSQMVSRGLVALPLVLVPGMDLLLGLPLLAFYATPAGRAVGLVGCLLVAAGGLAARGLVSRVPRTGRRDGAPQADEATDLLAAALLAGLPGPAAARAVAVVLPHLADPLRAGALCLEHGRPVVAGTPVAEALAVLALADDLGAPAAGELQALAAEQRAREHARVRRRAEQLPALLTIPSVLLLLPATVLLIGAPIVVAGLATSP